MASVGRNDPCPCGSGKKYKKCCAVAGVSASSPERLAQQLAAQCRQQAMQQYRAGRIDEARDSYKKVLSLQPDDVDVLCELGRLAYLTASTASEVLLQGIAYLRRAVALRGEDIGLHALLVRALVKNFSMAEAEQAAAVALGKFPGDSDVMVLRSTALIYLERAQEAVALLQDSGDSSARQPNIAAALAKAQVAIRQSDEARSVLHRCIDHNAAAARGMAAVWSELGALEDKEGNYDSAFAGFSRAGEAQLQQPELAPWQAEAGLDQVAQYRQWLVEGGVEALPVFSPSPVAGERKLIFFVGFPRSGTTLTEQIMAAHSQISTSEEAPHLGRALEKLFQRRGRSYDRDAVAVLRDCRVSELQQLREDYWRSAVQSGIGGSAVLVDKMPLNLLFIPWIQAAFPDAKLIFALRDPRDVCLSCFFQHFMPNAAMNHFLRWGSTTRYYREVMDLWLQAKSRLAFPYCEIKYEDTVADFSVQARRLIDFIGLDWEEGVLAYRERLQQRVVATPSHQAIKQPIYQKAKARWRNYPAAIAAAEQDLRPVIEALGYDG